MYDVKIEESELRKRLKIFIYGPYIDPCLQILKEVKNYLRNQGYTKTKLVQDLHNIYNKDDYETIEEFNLDISRYSFKHGDVFVFLIFQKKNRKKLRDIEDLNQGPSAELIEFLKGSKHSYGKVFFEGEAYKQTSTILMGAIEEKGFKYDAYPGGKFPQEHLNIIVEMFC